LFYQANNSSMKISFILQPPKPKLVRQWFLVSRESV